MLLGMLGCSGLFGCSDQPPPRSAQAEASVVRGSVYVAPGNDPEAKKLSDRLVAGLSRAGHTVVTSNAAEHEFTAELQVSVRETAGLLTVYVDGKPKKNHEAEAILKVTAAGQVITGERLKYDADDGPSDENMQALVSALSNAAAQKYVVGVRQQEGDAIMRQQAKDEAALLARKQQEEVALREERQKDEAAKREAVQQDDAAWNQIVLAECTAPTQLTGCESVKGYLAEYPTGRHVAEAKKAVNAGAPIIAKITDDRDWSAARAESCKKPKRSTDCDGVTSYLAAQPVGARADEARALLAQVEPTLESLRKAEEKRAKDAEMKAERDAEKADKALEAEEKATERKKCKRNCVGNCYSYPSGRFELCRDRCVQANCD
jgi:hypothetical protein